MENRHPDGLAVFVLPRVPDVLKGHKHHELTYAQLSEKTAAGGRYSVWEALATAPVPKQAKLARSRAVLQRPNRANPNTAACLRRKANAPAGQIGGGVSAPVLDGTSLAEDVRLDEYKPSQVAAVEQRIKAAAAQAADRAAAAKTAVQVEPRTGETLEQLAGRVVKETLAKFNQAGAVPSTTTKPQLVGVPPRARGTGRNALCIPSRARVERVEHPNAYR